MQNKKKANWGSLARLLRFLWQDYKLSLSISFVLIVVASLATVNLTASIQSLVDVYVQPMLKSGSHDFGPLLRFLTSVAVFCLIGVVANYVASLLMATISQDSLRSLRNQLFARMQKLPVRYFDTHQHGDIMSIYTNDIDALRQAVEHRAGAGVKLHLNVHKQVQVHFFLFRMRRQQRLQRVAFDELRRNRPLTVHRVNSQQLGNRQARLFHARRVQRFVQNVRLAVPFGKHFDGLGAVAVNLLIFPLGNHMRQIHRETSFYMVHVYWGGEAQGRCP